MQTLQFSDDVEPVLNPLNVGYDLTWGLLKVGQKPAVSY